jgi:hypothetical protein
MIVQTINIRLPKQSTFMKIQEKKRVLRLSSKILFICIFFSLFQSCGEKDLEVSNMQPFSQQKMEESVTYVASSKHMKIIIEGAVALNQLQKEKKLTTNRISEIELKNRLSTCKTEEDYRKVIATIASDPDAIIATMKKLNSALVDLDSEIHFSKLSESNKKELFKKSFQEFNKDNAGDSNNSLYKVDFLDGGGGCNSAYNRSMDNAAQNLLLATIVGYAGGMFGGPGGMAAGAATIAGAIVWYYIVSDYNLQVLGDCFSGCAPGFGG